MHARNMPARNIVKTYTENGYYHIYNRGVEKREIFLDEQDCEVFLYYLKMYLSPVDELKNLHQPDMRVLRFIPLNLSMEVDLLSFALMPNHIHLQIKQYTKDGIVKFTRRLLTSYVMYFNKKYKRVGALFQNTYKAALIDSDTFLLHLSRYIHLNPVGLSAKIDFLNFSSYPYYLRSKKASWVKPEEILAYFSTAKRADFKNILSYQSFVEDYREDAAGILRELTLEDE